MAVRPTKKRPPPNKQKRQTVAVRDVLGGMKRRKRGGAMQRTGRRPKLPYAVPQEYTFAGGYRLPDIPATKAQLQRLDALALRYVRLSIARKHADIPPALLAKALRLDVRTAQKDLADAAKLCSPLTSEAEFALDILNAMKVGSIAGPLGTEKNDLSWFIFQLVQIHTPWMSEEYAAFLIAFKAWERR